MSKFYRVMLFLVAMYMYYLFIIDNQEPLEAISKIVLVGILLVAMEFIRRGSYKIFEANSKLDEIDKMDKEKFIRYIAELYKRQGYQVFILQEDRKLGCDIKAYKGKDSLCIKCVHADEGMVVDKDIISEAYSSIQLYKVKRCIVITNNSFTEQAIDLAQANKVKTLDRVEIHNLICKVIHKEAKEEIKNAQEA